MKNQTAEGTSGKAGGCCRFAWKTVHKQRDFTLREWGGFCLFLKKKKMERGNKLNHILVCTKLIMVSKPYEYKILHYIQLSQFSLQNRKMGRGAAGLGGIRYSFANRACFSACMAQNERNPSPAAGTTWALYPCAHQDCVNLGRIVDGQHKQAAQPVQTNPAAVLLTACCWAGLVPATLNPELTSELNVICYFQQSSLPCKLL